MREVFVKARRGAPSGFFETEAAGLRWLTMPGGPRVAAVHEVGATSLTLERLVPVRPTAAAARDFGRRLAVLHDAGAAAWGGLPPGARGGFFGPLDDPLPMASGAWDRWSRFYAEARLLPILEQGRARGVFTSGDEQGFAAVVARLDDLIAAAGDDTPARLHGDLWSGNVMWVARAAEPEGADGVEAALIDPAAHGGHREADLAMLALFGAPHHDAILAGYREAHPLARGWEHRVGLHQLYPLAVHAVLFGGGYVTQTRRLVAGLGAVR